MNANNNFRYIEYGEKRQHAAFGLILSFVLFAAFIGFFVWHTVKMRNYELNFVVTDGTVIDMEKSTSSSSHGHTYYYYYVISYEFQGNTYSFTDSEGHHTFQTENIGKSTKIYVNPQNPRQAERVRSSDYASVICACFFAFFCLAYAAGMNFLLSLKTSTYKKRFLFTWGIEFLIGIAFILLFWLGLPHSGFGEVFIRVRGAVGITVILGLIMMACIINGIVTYKLSKKLK